jgi:hypothetical protein
MSASQGGRPRRDCIAPSTLAAVGPARRRVASSSGQRATAPTPGPHVPAASRLPQSTAFWAARWSSHGSRRVAEVFGDVDLLHAPAAGGGVGGGDVLPARPKARSKKSEKKSSNRPRTPGPGVVPRLGKADLAKSLRLRPHPAAHCAAGRIPQRSHITVDVGSPLLRAPLGRSPAPRAAKRSGSPRRCERSPQIAGIRYSASPRKAYALRSSKRDHCRRASAGTVVPTVSASWLSDEPAGPAETRAALRPSEQSPTTPGIRRLTGLPGPSKRRRSPSNSRTVRRLRKETRNAGANRVF